MTAKIKAQELVDKFKTKVAGDAAIKACSIIAVEEILNNIPKVKQLPSPNKPIVDFWNEVRNEINNL